jgi:hypothetical protein
MEEVAIVNINAIRFLKVCEAESNHLIAGLTRANQSRSERDSEVQGASGGYAKIPRFIAVSG